MSSLSLYLCFSVIGGTNESDHNDSPSMKRCLRKTRGELLLREYEVWEHHDTCFHIFHNNNKQTDDLEQTCNRLLSAKKCKESCQVNTVNEVSVVTTIRSYRVLRNLVGEFTFTLWVIVIRADRVKIVDLLISQQNVSR